MNGQTGAMAVQRAAELRRRWFLRECGIGLGAMAAASLAAAEGSAGLLADESAGASGPLAPRHPHFAPKAKRVIYMFQAGAPSHLELFDPKPELTRRNGQLPPPELLQG